MLRTLLQRLNFIGRIRARRAERERFDALVAEFHKQSRARVAELAAQGRGREALRENLAPLGIDINHREHFKLVGFGGQSFFKPEPPKK